MDKKQAKAIERYVSPFVQLLLEKGQQQDVFEKLSQIKAVCEETNLADFLSNIAVPETDKEKALRLFQQSGSTLLDNLIEVVIVNHREDLFVAIIAESLVELEKATNEFEVTIKSVSGLSDIQKQRLIPLIEEKLKIKVRSIKDVLEADLIGGFIISANHKTIDASIKGQLQAMKKIFR